MLKIIKHENIKVTNEVIDNYDICVQDPCRHLMHGPNIFIYINGRYYVYEDCGGQYEFMEEYAEGETPEELGRQLICFENSMKATNMYIESDSKAAIIEISDDNN